MKFINKYRACAMAQMQVIWHCEIFGTTPACQVNVRFSACYEIKF